MSNHRSEQLPIYSSDTSSLINAFQIPRGRIVLEYLANIGRIKFTPGVFRELEIGGDDVYDWALSKKARIEQEITTRSFSFLDHLIERYADSFRDDENSGLTYKGLVKKETASDADPEVIALARENGYIVLADETSGIKGACKLEGIECISTAKLIELEYPRVDRQLRFDDT